MLFWHIYHVQGCSKHLRRIQWPLKSRQCCWDTACLCGCSSTTSTILASNTSVLPTATSNHYFGIHIYHTWWCQHRQKGHGDGPNDTPSTPPPRPLACYHLVPLNLWNVHNSQRYKKSISYFLAHLKMVFGTLLRRDSVRIHQIKCCAVTTCSWGCASATSTTFASKALVLSTATCPLHLQIGHGKVNCKHNKDKRTNFW